MQKPPNGEPTPKQIADECRRIRDGWTEREHWVRSGHVGDKPELTVPVVRDCGRARSRLG